MGVRICEHTLCTTCVLACMRAYAYAYARVSKAMQELGTARRCAVTGCLSSSRLAARPCSCGGRRWHSCAPVASNPASNRLLLVLFGFPASNRLLLVLSGWRPAGRRGYARSAVQAGHGQVLLSLTRADDGARLAQLTAEGASAALRARRWLAESAGPNRRPCGACFVEIRV